MYVCFTCARSYISSKKDAAALAVRRRNNRMAAPLSNNKMVFNNSQYYFNNNLIGAKFLTLSLIWRMAKLSPLSADLLWETSLNKKKPVLHQLS